MTTLAQMDETFNRLLEEEEELRRISPIEGALGKNASDYRQMYDMFLDVIRDAKALRADPRAFVDSNGRYNPNVINAYAKLIGLGMKAIAELNKMRNQDQMTAHILDVHTRELVQALSVEFSVEVARIIEGIDNGAQPQDVAIELKRLLYRTLPDMFVHAAGSTLQSAKKEFGLIQ